MIAQLRLHGLAELSLKGLTLSPPLLFDLSGPVEPMPEIHMVWIGEFDLATRVRYRLQWRPLHEVGRGFYHKSGAEPAGQHQLNLAGRWRACDHDAAGLAQLLVSGDQEADAVEGSSAHKLIHDDLVHFDHNSLQDCRTLIELLDAQNPRILEQLAALRVLIDTFKATIAVAHESIDSDDFLRHVQPDPRKA